MYNPVSNAQSRRGMRRQSLRRLEKDVKCFELFFDGGDLCCSVQQRRDFPSLPRSILKSVMNDIPSAPIGDFENTLSFPSEETSLGSGIPSHLL